VYNYLNLEEKKQNTLLNQVIKEKESGIQVSKGE